MATASMWVRLFSPWEGVGGGPEERGMGVMVISGLFARSEGREVGGTVETLGT